MSKTIRLTALVQRLWFPGVVSRPKPVISVLMRKGPITGAVVHVGAGILSFANRDFYRII